ncbi:hypothetical protein ASPCADRAFT_398443 [Aspergillus carbonarius ITEM 5010]|uniref:Major facilitator superfamily (MFS) profile domain-containing protein n=1 Tax=Aspergillus carbonarius (strain ITEM 5010) TaxID=602072 RepID=A0A1R3RFY8_ASPC5|nr:hypothetical protein ASPCADRAFT_398443 [Aspergillus carbonarius ITEM 5010]
MCTTNPISSVKLYSILAGIMIATSLISLDVSIIAMAIPSIETQFHATTDIGWYGATYPLAMCSLQPLSGKVSSIFSLRWTYLVFYSIFLLGSLICGLANGSTMFIIDRAVAGSGGSRVVSGGLSVIAMVTTPNQRPLFTGLITSLYDLGTVVAPIIGGALAEYATWRWCFLIDLPAGAVTVVTLFLFFHPPRVSGAHTADDHQLPWIEKLDILGCALFIPSIVMLILALQWGGGDYTWDSATVIGLFVGFAVTIAIFILWERRMGDQAMIPMVLFRERSISLSIVFAVLFLGSLVIPVYYLPEWFQIVKTASPIRSGQIVSRTLAKYIRYFNPWFLVDSVFLCIANGLYIIFNPSSGSASWIGYQVLQGLGCGFAAQMPLLTVQHLIKDRLQFLPVAISVVMQSIGSVIFQNQVVGQLHNHAGLDSGQVEILLTAGALKVRTVANQAFPDQLDAVIAAYNDAITSVFWTGILYGNRDSMDRYSANTGYIDGSM